MAASVFIDELAKVHGLGSPGIYYSADVAVHGWMESWPFGLIWWVRQLRVLNPDVLYPNSPPLTHRSTILPPADADPPADRSLGTSPTVATEADSISAMPHSSQINQALQGHLPPRQAILQLEISVAVPRRRKSLIIHRRSWIPPIPTPAPLKVHGHGKTRNTSYRRGKWTSAIGDTTTEVKKKHVPRTRAGHRRITINGDRW